MLNVSEDDLYLPWFHMFSVFFFTALNAATYIFNSIVSNITHVYLVFEMGSQLKSNVNLKVTLDVIKMTNTLKLPKKNPILLWKKYSEICSIGIKL